MSRIAFPMKTVLEGLPVAGDDLHLNDIASGYPLRGIGQYAPQMLNCLSGDPQSELKYPALWVHGVIGKKRLEDELSDCYQQAYNAAALAFQKRNLEHVQTWYTAVDQGIETLQDWKTETVNSIQSRLGAHSRRHTLSKVLELRRSAIRKTTESLRGGEIRIRVPRIISESTPTAISGDAILSVLSAEETSPDVLRSWIVEAEAYPFEQTQLTTLRPILKRFIESLRDSSVRLDQIAVGSAIRKYVATMPPSEFASAYFLLDPGPTTSLPLVLELEVTKMIVRKLTALPELPDAPDLAERLSELSRAYLNDRLLPREKYGATALNALLGLALLRSDRLNDALGILPTLRSRWFLDHLTHRSRAIARDLERRFPREKVTGQLLLLSRLQIPTNAT